MSENKPTDVLLKDSVKNIAFYNAYKMQEHSSRETEVLEEQQNLMNINQENRVEIINEDLSKDKIDNLYSDMTKDEQLEKYKDLYKMQENYYIYNINNNSSDDSYVTENQLRNLKELDYIEKNVLSDHEKYNAQFESNQYVLNQNTIKETLDTTQRNYQEQSKILFQNSNNGENDIDELQDKTKRILADKKVLDNNSKFIESNFDDLSNINQKEKERLERKLKESKEIEKLQSKDIMWKIVEEQGKNNQFLTENGEQTLDARANADNIYRQISTNDFAQYGSNQVSRNNSYTNAYSSLQHSQRVSTANYTQNKEDQNNDKQQEQKDDNIQEKEQKEQKQQRRKGISL